MISWVWTPAYMLLKCSQFTFQDDLSKFYNSNIVPCSASSIILMFYEWDRSFRSIGDDSFMKAFEDTTLPFSEWTHEAHLRMAWNYIREDGVDKAVPRIK